MLLTKLVPTTCRTDVSFEARRGLNFVYNDRYHWQLKLLDSIQELGEKLQSPELLLQVDRARIDLRNVRQRLREKTGGRSRPMDLRFILSAMNFDGDVKEGF